MKWKHKKNQDKDISGPFGQNKMCILTHFPDISFFFFRLAWEQMDREPSSDIEEEEEFPNKRMQKMGDRTKK